MSHRHQPAPTTRTIELRQVQDINRRLAAPGSTQVTAEALGVAGSVTASPTAFGVDLFGPETSGTAVLRPTAVLCFVSAEGSPEFPYVLGHFAASPMAAQRAGGVDAVIELHSAGLRRLSAVLGLRHCWGTDAVLVARPWVDPSAG